MKSKRQITNKAKQSVIDGLWSHLTHLRDDIDRGERPFDSSVTDSKQLADEIERQVLRVEKFLGGYGVGL